MTKGFAESALTLLRSQPYISSCDIYTGEHVDVDLDMFRFAGANLITGDVATWPCMTELCTPDLTRPWLHVDAIPHGGVIVSRTPRYRNLRIRYPRIGSFVGLKEENDLGLPYIETPTLLDLARQIAGCKFFIGNQSLAFAIASALDVPRILEWAPACPNVQIHTTNGFAVWNQEQMDEAVQLLARMPHLG